VARELLWPVIMKLSRRAVGCFLLVLTACGGSVVSGQQNGARSEPEVDAGRTDVETAGKVVPAEAGLDSDVRDVVTCEQSLDGGDCSSVSWLCDTFGNSPVNVCSLADVTQATPEICGCTDDVVTRETCSGGMTVVTFAGVHSGARFYYGPDGQLVAVIEPVLLGMPKIGECALGPKSFALPVCGDAGGANLCVGGDDAPPIRALTLAPHQR
jgi:hypothetical protein